jgi:hypothetical protein
MMEEDAKYHDSKSTCGLIFHFTMYGNVSRFFLYHLNRDKYYWRKLNSTTIIRRIYNDDLRSTCHVLSLFLE